MKRTANTGQPRLPAVLRPARLRPAGLLLVGLLLAGLFLSACGGSSVTPADQPTSSNPNPNAAASAPAGSGGVMRYPVVGRVWASDGGPVAGALVTAVSVDNPSHPVPELAVSTDAKGDYAWPSLSPGRYEMRVNTSAGAGAVTVTVVTTGSVRGDLTLK